MDLQYILQNKQYVKVSESINYWRHKHKIDARKISQSLPNDEDEINNMISINKKKQEKLCKNCKMNVIEILKKMTAELSSAHSYMYNEIKY